ncbi:MAG: hypothetical protein ACFFFG_11845 [Candidatus Thorarchaeota archaeon]
MSSNTSHSSPRGTVAQILRLLSALRDGAAVTVQELKASINHNLSWSLFLCGLAYLSEIRAIQISDAGMVARLSTAPITIPLDIETRLQEIVRKYDVTQNQAYRVI